MQRTSTFVVAVGIAVASIAGAQATQFPNHRVLRAALCHGPRACRVDSVLRAGADDHGSPLAVVHLTYPAPAADAEEEGCHAYSDRLVTMRRGHLIELRELSRGDVRCLEWHPGTWSYENGELVFEHGGMGAPPGPGTEMRATRTHFRPWPLEVTAEYVGTDRVSPLPTLPARGPLFVLSMDEEGFGAAAL